MLVSVMTYLMGNGIACAIALRDPYFCRKKCVPYYKICN